MSGRPAFDYASPRGDHPDLLAKRVTTVQDLRREVLDRWNNKSPTAAPAAFREIPVPLRFGETVQEYTKEFEMWLLRRNETFETLRFDPSRERGFWFSFAYKRAGTCTTVALGDKVVPRTSDMDELISHYGPQPENADKRVRRSNSDSEPDRGHHATEATSTIDLSVDEEAEQHNSPGSEARARDQGSAYASSQYGGNVAVLRAHRDGTVTSDRSESSTSSPPDPVPTISLPQNAKEDAAQACAIIPDEDVQHVQRPDPESQSPLARPRKRSLESAKECVFVADAAVHRDLELALHSQVSDDDKLQLALIYDKLDQQIASTGKIDELQAGGDHISETARSSTQLRSKRTAVLAALIVSDWARRQESLVAVLEDKYASAESAKPANLAALLSEIGEIAKQLKTLEDQRDTQVQLVSSLPPAATAAGRALRLKKLRKLSAVVSEKRVAQERLQCEFEDALKRLMQSDGKARKLVKDALGTCSAA
ncbi:hypothetical protein PHYSODRAFT_307956 [Phytophthora sojae]|uniref:Uncharacterized protein n=1 Tax=Phytophthora sojae (strain P6497) TaxID=1094619 RepID=G5AHA6_PHYSP|nr:hypothetical protein PHYSODRAFT_307956 [Phytophthora sojae]EGZ05085.1 hypothetical protein PHYSODRAFT_307956 [Phytophthora sojae]|eukprot:XP_009539457.1 hypothetical protein PHYSODRAFT_307956 [Phytophthora sojae]